MTYSIRRLTADDVDAYRAIRLEALTNHPESYGSSPERFAATATDSLIDLLSRMAFFGAVTDAGELAGIVALAATKGSASAIAAGCFKSMPGRSCAAPARR